MSLQMLSKQFGRQLISKHVNRCLNKDKLSSSPKMTFRSIHKSMIGKSGSYEGDGKTTVTIINKDETGHILIDSYSTRGFRLSNGMFALGPIALLPVTILQWDVRDASEINEKSLSLFYLMEPRIEILVIGVGDDSIKIDPKIRLFLSNKNINCEILPTKHAVTTYNFLNADQRICAGAFIPPTWAEADPEEDPFLMGARNRFIADKGFLE